MELSRDSWDASLIPDFQNYLKSFENNDKKEWCINILKTSLPVLCMQTSQMKEIINKISKGNYLQFLDLMIWDYYENTAINGFLICKIRDFDVMKKYLDIYSAKADNWATCDLLTFNINGRENKYFTLAKEYIKSSKPFVRRIGINVLFYFIENDTYIDEIFNILNDFKNEEDYYVNMICAWLLSDCFIKQRTKTLEFLKNNNTNDFIINKGIQKCRDSRRVSEEDKTLLNNYKR